MLKLFSRNTIVQALLILLVLVLLWLRPLLTPVPMQSGEHPAILYGLLCQWLSPHPLLAVILAMVIVLVEGLMLNLLLANVGLVPQNSLLATFLFVLATGAGATTLTPAILVNGALVAALSQLLLRGTLLTITSDKACGATALIGLATLFYQPAVVFLLSYFLIAANYRLYDWKDWAVLILGFVAPYLPVLAYLYLFDGMADWWQGTAEALGTLSLQYGAAMPISLAGGLLLTILLLWSLAYTAGRLGERPVVWQKNATTVMLLIVGGLALYFYQPIMPLRPGYWTIPFVFCLNRLLVGTAENRTGYGRRRNRTWIFECAFDVAVIAAFLC